MGIDNMSDYENKSLGHSTARVGYRNKRKMQAEGIAAYADLEYQETAAAELCLTWQGVEMMWTKLEPWRNQTDGTDPKLDEALTRFKAIIRRISDKARNKEKVDPRDAFDLDSIWRKMQGKFSRAERVNDGERT